ncbi:hypothetical protein [Burkholderia gladioli]|uniref:hypothetical protein n=1 Tax=Burkholderia gladioli TaxID=28095 RepID=UPI0016404D88|nr:hypothetical protein [Burkholderia gladioli]
MENLEKRRPFTLIRSTSSDRSASGSADLQRLPARPRKMPVKQGRKGCKVNFPAPDPGRDFFHVVQAASEPIPSPGTRPSSNFHDHFQHHYSSLGYKNSHQKINRQIINIG